MVYNIKEKPKKSNAVLYGLLAGTGLLVFYISVVSYFQGIEFAFSNLRSLWYLIFPLIIGFGIQVGLFFSIKHAARTIGMTSTVSGTGAVSGGSMVACCSHFLVNLIPFIGFSGAALFLIKYQKLFLVIGIVSNIIGISVMMNHKQKMKKMKGGN